MSADVGLPVGGVFIRIKMPERIFTGMGEFVFVIDLVVGLLGVVMRSGVFIRIKMPKRIFTGMGEFLI